MKKYLLFLLLIIALQTSKAQSNRFKFDHFTVKDGLPSNNGLPEPDINFVKQDDQGYLWIGTQNGLVRYDGYNLKVYLFGVTRDAASSNCQVLSMVTDESKNLWFSTAGNGLFRYNRATDSFMQYKYPPKHNINAQNLILADSKGNLWGSSIREDINFDPNSGKFKFEMSFDLVKFNPKNKHFDYFGPKQKGTYYLNYTDKVLKSAAPGHPIWVGTDKGLCLFNDHDNTFHPYFSVLDTARQKSVNQIHEARSDPGILWLNVTDHFSKQTLVERFDTRNKTFKDYNPGTGPGLTASNDTINDIFEDHRHRLWIASAGGLMYFNRKTETFTNYSPSDTVVNKNKIYSIAEAKNGSLWLRCGKGLLNFDPEAHQFQRAIANPSDPAALTNNTINDLMVDRLGTLWAGINGKGVDKLNDLTSAFTTYTYDDKAPAKCSPLNGIGLITSSADGYLWFNNKQGIYKWKPGSDQFMQVYKASKVDGDMQMFTLGKEGIVYFSNGKGLRVYDPVSHKLQNYAIDTSKAASLYSNYISRAVQDHTGLVWFGTYDKGLYSFNPVSHQFTSYPFPDNKGQKDGKSKPIALIFEDRHGMIWVGADKGGLSRFDQKTGKFKPYLLSDKKGVESINEIFEDKEGRLWIGTDQNGLFEFDGKSGTGARNIYKDKGLLFHYIFGINEDNKGFIWVNSDDSLSRVNPNNMSVKTFPWDIILPGKNRQSGLHSLPAGNGQMVIGIDNGIAVFNPRDIDVNPYPPVVHIEKLGYSDPASRSDSSTTRIAYNLNKIELPYNQNRITFSYVAIHFTNPAQNKYAYTLKGYDNRWIQAGTVRSATYTNLSPGTYTFKVKAANSDGVWNNTGDSFTLIIDSPWWQKWWAWLLYIILFAAAIYAFVYYRSRQLMKDKRVLEQQVEIRTEEVIQQKEEIEAQRDNLEKSFKELKTTQTQLIQSEKMASLGELTAGIAHEIQNPLNFVNNFSEVNREMLEELKAESQKPKAERDEQLEISLISDLIENEQKINHHGKRADSIVKGMLEHSRSRSGQKEPTDINAIADEFMRLSYHGLRSKDKSFNSELITHFGLDLPKISVVQQDIGRVLLNLFNNAFYAVNQKMKISSADYKPAVEVETFFLPLQGVGGFKVKDNGVGIPDAIKEKIMQPFFTTKPTGEGTGLGLSLTYDMVVKGHGGTIKVESKDGEGSEFVITLPVG